MIKVALITGCSTGLGISIATQLAKQGYRVFATMRNLDKQPALQQACEDSNVEVAIKQLDVQDIASIERCVNDIVEQEGRIDILVNNAGAGFVKSTEQASEAEIAWVMDVNFHGVVRCTKAVMPYMRSARSGHIINISSVGGLVGQPFSEIYCAAKFAVEGYTESLASYVQPTFNVKFTSVQPGGISSEFATNVMSQMQNSGGMLDDEYRPVLDKYIGGARTRAADRQHMYQTSEQVAEVVVGCIENPDPPVRIRTSDWSNQFCDIKTQADPDGKLQQQRVIDMFL